MGERPSHEANPHLLSRRDLIQRAIVIAAIEAFDNLKDGATIGKPPEVKPNVIYVSPEDLAELARFKFTTVIHRGGNTPQDIKQARKMSSPRVEFDCNIYRGEIFACHGIILPGFIIDKEGNSVSLKPGKPYVLEEVVDCAIEQGLEGLFDLKRNFIDDKGRINWRGLNKTLQIATKFSNPQFSSDSMQVLDAARHLWPEESYGTPRFLYVPQNSLEWEQIKEEANTEDRRGILTNARSFFTHRRFIQDMGINTITGKITNSSEAVKLCKSGVSGFMSELTTLHVVSPHLHPGVI